MSSMLDEADDDGQAALAARLRALRDARGLTLDALAERSGVSRAMLSRVERGESSPTAQLLVKIANGLGLTLSALLSDPAAPAGPLARRAHQPVWRDPATGYLRRDVSPPGTGSPVEIVEVEFPTGGSVLLDGFDRPGADQQVWVLEGTLELAIGPEVFRLGPGDCLHMGFDRPIRFRNAGERSVRYAVVGRGGAAGRP